VKRLSFSFILFVLAGTIPAKATELLVFAASSTTNAFSDVTLAYERKTGVKVRVSFAGSSKLAYQIYAGAPADLFLSANVGWMNYLEENGAIESQTRATLFSNSLVLIQPIDGSEPLTLETLGNNLSESRLAMADPDHVPAGIYAKQALMKLELWPRVVNRIAAMPSVRSAMALVSRGEAAAGIVYKTDAKIGAGIRVSAPIPANIHDPIRYPIAVVKGHLNPAVIDFLKFLKSDQAVKLFTNHGFLVSN
jgi:molybdate transport system substrate-binding protein